MTNKSQNSDQANVEIEMRHTPLASIHQSNITMRDDRRSSQQVPAPTAALHYYASLRRGNDAASDHYVRQLSQASCASEMGKALWRGRSVSPFHYRRGGVSDATNNHHLTDIAHVATLPPSKSLT